MQMNAFSKTSVLVSVRRHHHRWPPILPYGAEAAAISYCVHHSSSTSYPLPLSSTTNHQYTAPIAKIRKSNPSLQFHPTVQSSSSFPQLFSPTYLKTSKFLPNCYNDVDSIVFSDDNNDDGYGAAPDGPSSRSVDIYRSGDDDNIEIEIEIEKTGKNCRRIRSKIAVEASLQTVWTILTDYERLADFIPGLALSRLLEKRDNFVRLLQIGQQNLAFGIKFNAKGVVDCCEKDLETLPFGQRRDIEFRMIEGDFQVFQGKWSIEQYGTERREKSDSLVSQEFHTTLKYVVDLEPKLWLPVRLVEGRLCREIKANLMCIREEAKKACQNTTVAY